MVRWSGNLKILFINSRTDGLKNPKRRFLLADGALIAFKSHDLV